MVPTATAPRPNSVTEAIESGIRQTVGGVFIGASANEREWAGMAVSFVVCRIVVCGVALVKEEGTDKCDNLIGFFVVSPHDGSHQARDGPSSKGLF